MELLPPADSDDQSAWGYGTAIFFAADDYGTPNVPGAEYVIPNFPNTPFKKRWKEMTQDRLVSEEWVGREAVFPWEVKVYGLV